jgi:antitoxin HigA-1
MKTKKLAPVHPGEVLKEDFMDPLGLSATSLAKGLGVQPITISLLVRGKRNVSAEMALRLSRYTGTSAQFWINLQGHYDLDVARDELEKRIEREVKPREPVHA